MNQRSRPGIPIAFIIGGLIVLVYCGYLSIDASLGKQTVPGSLFAYLVLGVVAIIAGLYTYRLHQSAESSEQDQISPSTSDTGTSAIQELEGSDQQGLPKICTKEDCESLPSLNSEQLYILQNLFRDQYRIRVERIEGGYSNSGVFQVIRETEEGNLLEPGVVVKFLAFRDILKEKNAYRNVLDKHPLAYTPGRPIGYWPAEDQLSESGRLGAVSYQLATLNPGSQLQTLNKIYCERSFEEFLFYLKLLFERLDRWYALKWRRPGGSSLGGPNGIYGRFYRKRDDIENGVSQLIRSPATSARSALPTDDLVSRQTIALPWLAERWESTEVYNPIYWVHHVFAQGRAECFKSVSPYSPVHGDLYTGNVLIERGRDTQIWLIDFPNAHIGPSLQDFATLEADVKFNLIDMEQCSFDDWLKFEQRLLFPLSSGHETLDWPWSQGWQPTGEVLLRAWQVIGFLRRWARERRLIGDDVYGYYLALLHNTLPVVYRPTHTESQKQAALVSAAWMCEHLSS